MRQVAWASVRIYGRRYVAAALAIMVGVCFIVVTDAVSSAARSGLLADLSEQYTGGDAVVIGAWDVTAAQDVLRTAGRLDAPATVNAMAVVTAEIDGRSVSDDAPVGSVSSTPELRWQQVTAGRFPTGPGEALVDEIAAETNHVHIGDRVHLGERGPDSDGAVTVTVTGLTASSSGRLASAVYVGWSDLQRLGDAVFVNDVLVAGGEHTTGDLVSALDRELPKRMEVQSTTDYLSGLRAQADNGVDVLSVLLLLFAAIAFFVSMLVIANTFTILLAQRVRDFALLRCVGASRRQIIRSVRTEALILGTASATMGVLLGTATGYGLVALATALFPAVPVGSVQLSGRWVGGAWSIGVAVTLVASLLPARRSTRVSPLAALRPELAVDVRTRAGLARVLAAGVVTAAGAALLAASVAVHNLFVLIAGGGVSFVGVLLFGPVLVPACTRLLGLVVRRMGIAGRLSAENSVRNPRRTAATAASLLVGVTLISGLVVGIATVRATIGEEMDQQYPVDATLTAVEDPLGPGTLDKVQALQGVGSAVAVEGVTARLSSAKADLGPMLVLGTDAGAADVAHGELPTRSVQDRIVLDWSTMAAHDLVEGQRLTVSVAGANQVLRIVGAEGYGGAALVSDDVLRSLHGDPQPRAVWVQAEHGADSADLQGRVTAVAEATGTDYQGGLEQRASVDLQLDVMTGAAVALLAVGLVIALIGVGNTLGLSVLERTREHALLRAMGLTRRQLRGTLALEAGMLAAVAGILGVALGSCYAWVAVRAVVGEVIDDTRLVLPVGQLALIVAVTSAAGLVACLLPARRAAAVTPAQGLTAD